MAFNIDTTTRNASVAIVFDLDLLFFIATVTFTVNPGFPMISTRLWDLFCGTNAALFLALNIDTGKPTSPPAVLAGA
jgi:hypothetical protein